MKVGQVKLYNSLSKQVETFQARGDEVSLYVCGITPYDTTHLGHAFTYTVADVLVRYLETTGLKVRYVQNVTDIDDDILKRANEVEKDWKEVGDEWTAYFIRDMKMLNVLPPDVFPRATDVIPEIIIWVEKLLEQGVAYVSGGSVYFDVVAYEDFGKLSRLPREDMLDIANQRGNNPDDPNKRNPLDFVLWQARAPGEPAWDSPWGPGRPGWHIECSTMCKYFLGDTVDIHSGGEDLCFPHHEAEIAQMEPVTGKEPVRYWMHIAMVRHEDEKMSKSLGNLVMVRDVLENWSSDAVRLYLGSFHYRNSWSHDEGELKQAQQNADKIRRAVAAAGGSGEVLVPASAWEAFCQEMDNDLDTPLAQKTMLAFADEVLEAARADRDIGQAQAILRRMSVVFGLRLDGEGPEARVVEGWDAHLVRFRGETEISR